MGRQSAIVAVLGLLVAGTTSVALQAHTVPFTLANTGGGVADGRLRFAFNTLPVPGETYFLDNVSLTCGGPEIVSNGDFGAGPSPWHFYTNAVAPAPSFSVVSGEAQVSFGNDASNTQLYESGRALPAAATACTLTFDGCSTFGDDVLVELIRHTSPYTGYGLSVTVALDACSAGPTCGNSVVEPPEQCDSGGVNSATCDADCTLPQCGDGVTNTAAGEECDDGNQVDNDLCDNICLVNTLPTNTGATGGSQPHGIRDPYLGLNYIIALEGIYPSSSVAEQGFSSALQGSEPFIGEVILFAGNFAPRGWAFCQGQLLSIASNTALFSILGTTYGGNGQTTFALPDLRGRVPVQPGAGPGLSNILLGEMGGAEAHTLTVNEMPSHSHAIP